MPFSSPFKKPKKSVVVCGALVASLALALYFASHFTSANSWPLFAEDFKQFNGVYEPSAAQQLKNGSIVVLEDEVSRALNLLEFDSEENLLEDSIHDKKLNAQLKQSFDDLEGIAVSKEGVVYATTSFSRTGSGKRRPNREKLLRFEINESGELEGVNAYKEFVQDLKGSTLFERLKVINGGKTVKLKNINIEGLSFDADKRHLLFGFKKPLVNDLSMIIHLENPQQVLDGTHKPVLSEEPTLLELHGGGIRSLFYDQALQGYLIANEVDFGGGQEQSQLWFWSGDKQQEPIPLILPEITDMENIEAISAVTVNGQARVLLMSDDGSRKNKQPAHYRLIKYDEIKSQITPE